MRDEACATFSFTAWVGKDDIVADTLFQQPYTFFFDGRIESVDVGLPVLFESICMHHGFSGAGFARSEPVLERPWTSW
jgi:hypothetical protein